MEKMYLPGKEKILCPLCSTEMRKAYGKFGEFYSCKNYFKTGCKGTRKASEVENKKNIIDSKLIQKNNLIVDIPEDDSNTPLIATKKFPYLNFKFEYFNPVQSRVFEFYSKDINLVIAAATSAGKTTMAEMLMADSISKGKKAIFLSPLKAISQEKYDEWSNEKHGFSKKNISIVTGDYALTEKRIEELNNADIIIMTTEMMDSRTRRIKSERNDWLLKVGTVVCDEAHMLCMTGRGDRVESAIMRFTEQNEKCGIVLLSATMPNVSEIAKWLTFLNKKETKLINSNYRPCKLDIHYEKYYDKDKYLNVENNKIEKAIEITQQHRTDKFLIFVHAKKTGKALVDQLKFRGESAEIFNADLESSKRIAITNAFRNDLRIIVTTSALAWGVNLPCRRAIIVGIHRGINEIEPLDVKQMIGRAGRVGLDPKGDAYILLPESKFAHYKSWCENIPSIKSTFNDEDVLAFHVVSEIANKNVNDVTSLMHWYNRSLAAFQNDKINEEQADLLLQKLERMKILDKEENKYSISKLGQVAANLYFSPYSVAGWYFNFNTLFKNNRVNDVSIGWALSNVHQYTKNFAQKEVEDQTNNFIKQSEIQGLKTIDSSAYIGMLFYSCLRYDDSVNSKLKYQVQFDFERISAVLEMIDTNYAGWKKGNFWKRLGMRIQYEITEEQTELCTVKGIGGIYVRKLFDAGITSVKKLKSEVTLAKKVLGSKYESIIKNI